MYKQAHHFISKELHAKFKSKCRKKGKTMSRVLQGMIVKFVEN